MSVFITPFFPRQQEILFWRMERGFGGGLKEKGRGVGGEIRVQEFKREARGRMDKSMACSMQGSI